MIIIPIARKLSKKNKLPVLSCGGGRNPMIKLDNEAIKPVPATSQMPKKPPGTL